MTGDIKTQMLPQEIEDKIRAAMPEWIEPGTYEEAKAYFELGEPKMKMEVLQDAEKFKGAITDVRTTEDQSVIISVATPPGKTEKDCWNALFRAGIDEMIRRQNS
jgi:hypothetical protein